MRKQNAQVAAGGWARRLPGCTDSEARRQHAGRLTSEAEFSRHRQAPTPPNGSSGAPSGHRPRRAPAPTPALGSTRTTSGPAPIFQGWLQRHPLSNAVRADDGGIEEFPSPASTPDRLRPDRLRAPHREGGPPRCSRPSRWWLLVVIVFLQTWRASSSRCWRCRCRWSAPSRACCSGFSINALIAVRPGAVDRHRGRRRHRGGRERRQHRGDLNPRDAAVRHAGGCRARSSPSPWCCARCSCRWPSSPAWRAVLPPVRGDHRDFHGDLGLQLADALAGDGGHAAAPARRAQDGRRADGRGVRRFFPLFNRLFTRSRGYGRSVRHRRAASHRRCCWSTRSFWPGGAAVHAACPASSATGQAVPDRHRAAARGRRHGDQTEVIER